MTSDSGCCCWYCFIDGRDDSKPWHKRHLFGQIVSGIGFMTLIVLGFATGLGAIGLFLFGSGYVGGLILPFVDISGREFKCLDDYFACGAIGIMYYIALFLAASAVNAAILPLHLLCRYLTKTWKYSFIIILPVFIPAYLFGPELFASILPGTGCHTNSYYGFMNSLCMIIGVMGLLGIGAGWLGIFVLVALIYCLKMLYDSYKKKINENNTVKVPELVQEPPNKPPNEPLNEPPKVEIDGISISEHDSTSLDDNAKSEGDSVPDQ